MQANVVPLERVRKREDYFTPKSLCFSDSCPASKEINLKETEIIKKDSEIHIYKETIKQLWKSTEKRKEIKKGEVFLKKVIVEFQEHLEKIATQRQIATLQARVNVLEQRASGQTQFDLSRLKFIGDPNNPFAPKFVSKEAEKRFWKSNYTLDQMLEDAEVDESIE